MLDRNWIGGGGHSARGGQLQQWWFGHAAANLHPDGHGKFRLFVTCDHAKPDGELIYPRRNRLPEVDTELPPRTPNRQCAHQDSEELGVLDG
jgi:hypothetical protein